MMSVEDYLALDRASNNARYEYIDGYAIMMAGGSLDHSTISINLTSLLNTRLRGSPCRVYNSDARVRLAEARYVYPDASISCDARDKGTGDIVSFPSVVFEVLSPGTESYDRSTKFLYYRACPTIEEYVLIDTKHQAVDIYRRATENLWALHLYGPGDIIEPASVRITFTIDELYEGVDFPGEGE